MSAVLVNVPTEQLVDELIRRRMQEKCKQLEDMVRGDLVIKIEQAVDRETQTLNSVEMHMDTELHSWR